MMMRLFQFMLFLALAHASHLAMGQHSVPFDCRENVSVDSLVKTCIQKSYDFSEARQVDSVFESADFKAHHYDASGKFDHDSVFKVCLNHLKGKLGNDSLCELLSMSLNGLQVMAKGQYFILSFRFRHPCLNNRSTAFKYIGYIDRKGNVSIRFPGNLGDGEYLSDCIYVISREMALERMKRWGLITEDDDYRMSLNGTYWDVIIFEDESNSRSFRMHLTSGQFSGFQAGVKTD